MEHGLVAEAARDRAIEQLGGAVQALRILQLRQIEAELRPERARRQVVAREGVEMSRVGWHGPLLHVARRAASLVGALCARSVGVGGERLARDDDLLHLRGALVDPERPDLAIQPLDRVAGDHAERAVDLHRLVDHALRGLGGVELGHGGLAGDALGAASFAQAAR